MLARASVRLEGMPNWDWGEQFVGGFVCDGRRRGGCVEQWLCPHFPINRVGHMVVASWFRRTSHLVFVMRRDCLASTTEPSTWMAAGGCERRLLRMDDQLIQIVVDEDAKAVRRMHSAGRRHYSIERNGDSWEKINFRGAVWGEPSIRLVV